MLQKKEKIGLGTRKLQGESAISAVKDAIEIGYRHIDTARIYHNASEIKQALSLSGINRSELTITSKVRFDYEPNYEKHTFTRSDFSYSLRERRFEEYLQALGVDYLDEMLIHRPTWEENDLTLLKLLALYQQKGVIKQVGVANFPLWYLKTLWDQLPCALSSNQIELHPCLFDEAMLAFAKEKNLTLTAYSPLGQGKLLKQKALIHIAEKAGIAVSQLCIAYLLTKGVQVIPKASCFSRLQANFEAQNIQLSPEIIAQIDQLPKHFRYCNPPFAPKWDND